jgi:hypothetical protein
MVKELFMLARIAQQDHKLPGFRAQQWFFFFVATFYLYLRWVGEGPTVRAQAARLQDLEWVQRRKAFDSSSAAERIVCMRSDTLEY